MNDTTETTEVVEATVAPVARKRAPAITATVDGVSHKLLKYAFPSKAIPFTVNVNGVEVNACSTTGRGASYTYLLINNTGFYLPKDVTLESGAEVTIDFPEDYAFDEEQAVRVSTYKPKTSRATDDDEYTAEDEVDEADAEDPNNEAETTAEAVEEPAPTAKRRSRKS